MITNDDHFLYHKSLPPRRFTGNREDLEALRKEGWKDTYMTQEFPKTLHHATKPPLVVATKEAEAVALKKGYKTVPSTICDYTLEEFVALGYDESDYPPYGTTARTVSLEEEQSEEQKAADAAKALADARALVAAADLSSLPSQTPQPPQPAKK